MPTPPTLGLFVYGTLRPSKSDILANMTKGLQFPYSRDTLPVIENALLHDFKLWKVASFPGIKPNECTAVLGDWINLVSLTAPQLQELLERLDRYEGTPHLYTRQEVTVELPSTEASSQPSFARAFVYVYNRDIPEDRPEGRIVNVENCNNPVFAW